MECHLHFVISNLIQAGYYQFVSCYPTQLTNNGNLFLQTIPLLALYDHIVSSVCRNTRKCIEAQIMKLEVCIKLRLFSPASRLLLQLFTGEKLCDSQPTQTLSKAPVNLYNDRQYINDETNLMVLCNYIYINIKTFVNSSRS